MKMHSRNTTIPIYGDTKYRGDCPTESAEQITFFNTIRTQYPALAKIATHQRNEGKRTHAQTNKQKIEGMTTGAADIIIPGNPAFVCEMKRRDHTKCKFSKDQEEYLLIAQKFGSFVCVALGYEAALAALEKWVTHVHTRTSN